MSRAPLRISPQAWRASLICLGLWSAIVGACITLYVQPSPRIHDEFSYLLAADTLLHGRLANPTPPVWEALQSFHVVLQPTYASKYPLGVGLLIALGTLLCGTPLAGSWIGAGILTASATWMLAAVLPRRWAILGGLILSVHPFVQLAWTQSLLHGFLPATGCALLTGGALRMRRRVEFSTALWSGLGVALLALSRPFEGLTCTAISTVLLWMSWQHYSFSKRLKMAFAAGFRGALPVAGALMLVSAHNQAVSGRWWTMPYQLHEREYAVAPLFVFGQPRPTSDVDLAHQPAVLQYYHSVDSLEWYRARAGWRGWLRGLYDSSGLLFILSFPFVGALAISGSSWTRFRLSRALCIAIALQVAASCCVCWVYAHYLAPVLPWLLLISLMSLRYSHARSSLTSFNLPKVVLISILIVQVVCLIAYSRVARQTELESWSRHRQAIVHRLADQGGQHLVLVRYAASHNVHQDWVYNDADPTNSRIVWARYEDGRWVEPLLAQYGSGRSVWVIDADDCDAALQPYAVPTSVR